MNELKKKTISEFVASFILGFLGLGLVVPYALGGYINSLFEYGILFGMIIAFVIIIFNPISGAQFNPAVTISMIISGRQNKNTLIPFIIAQIFGWGLGSFCNYLVFPNQMLAYAEAGNNPVTLFFCNTADVYSGIILEIVGTAVMLMVICSFIDSRCVNRPTQALFPFAIAFLIWFLVSWSGGYTGTAINVARDLGPRVFGYIYGLINGYDVSSCFSTGIWIIYVICPIIGGVLGVTIFDKLISKIYLENK